MSTKTKKSANIDFEMLNKVIAQFPQVHPITKDMKLTHEGVSRLVMLDRYAFKDTEKKTLKVGDFVVLTVKPDPKFPARGFGFIQSIDREKHQATIQVADEFKGELDGNEADTGIIVRNLDAIDKPLEVFYEQIAKRNANGLASVEENKKKRKEWFDKFYNELSQLRFVPAGRVLYGAGAET